MSIDDIILRFFRDDVGGVLVVNGSGETVYKDQRAEDILREAKHWAVACPPPRVGQKGEIWDLPRAAGEQPYMVTTSTFAGDGELFQIHYFTDSSIYMNLLRDLNSYSSELKAEKERDGMTDLYNKGKLLELKQTLLRDMDAIAVLNMDVNNLKQMNDVYGHEAGDRLICKAADSLRRIEARNVLVFRVGGDEFMAVALHVSWQQAEALVRKWEEGLEALNQVDDGVRCVMACGMAWGERGYDLDALFALADQRMYENKQALKRGEECR